MASQRAPSDRVTGWRMIGLGFFLILAGVAGASFAWFPGPPLSGGAPLVGWPARWFATGVAWFGPVVIIAGVAALRGHHDIGRLPRRAARGAFMLAVACWLAFLVSLFPW